MGLLDYFNRGTDALAGTTGSYGGLLDDEQQMQAQQAARMALASQLLEAGGWNEQRTNLGQALGRGMAAAGQARQGSVDQALQAALLKKQIQAAQQQQRKNHVIGNALVDDEGNVVYRGDVLDNTFGRINPGDYTPASLKKFKESGDFGDLQRVWAPPSPTVVQMAGAPNLVQGDRNGGMPRVMPLSTPEAELTAVANKARTESEARGLGQLVGEAKGSVEKKAITAENVLAKLELADPLIDAATGSLAGAGVDKLAAVFGQSLSGDQATAQLKVLQADLMTSMPRMEGPQSDRDVELYGQAAGELGDATVPRQRKKAAVQMIRALQMKYADAGTANKAPAAGKRPPLSSFTK